jgi:hypothetical protein
MRLSPKEPLELGAGEADEEERNERKSSATEHHVMAF